MDEKLFIQAVNSKAREFSINPLLLLSGIEGIYTFRNVPLNTINYEFLVQIPIPTIFALRIGDQFHSIAESNLSSPNSSIRQAAVNELETLSNEVINQSGNIYLQSFSRVLNGKSPIRKYHEKALEVAAKEISNARMKFNNNNISNIVIAVCKNDHENTLGLASLFNS